MSDPRIALALAVALPFLAALAIAVSGRFVARHGGWLVAAAAAASVALLARLALRGGPPVALSVAWLPDIDVAFALRADPFGLFLALLVAAVGVLIALYAIAYLDDDDVGRLRRFHASLAAFMGAMLGVALADDLILLFVFWELTSISSFLLIGYWSEQDDAKAGALTALQVTALGGLVMSVGFLLIGQVCGTFSLSVISSDPTRISALLASPLADAALLLVLVGAATKSAQVPFHFWLPGAMVAPTPVSAYLHAATMVKAGVFLLGRMLPILGGSPWWFPLLVTLGTVTMLAGAYQATRENDLKAILARTTGSTLGLLFLLYGIGAAEQDALQILNHALYKGALFLVAGIVEHHAHSRDLTRLGGLRRALPLPFAASVLAALSMAGVPPLFGFLAKESVGAALLAAPALQARPIVHGVVIVSYVATSALLVATAYRLVAGIFLGRPRADADHAGAPAHGTGWLSLSPLLLAAAALGLGLLGFGSLPAWLVSVASSRADAAVELSLIPHVDAALALTLIAWLLGAAAYQLRDRLGAAIGAVTAPLPRARPIWQAGLDAVIGFGDAYSRRWENGSLRWYLAASLLATPVLIACAAYARGAELVGLQFQFGAQPWYGIALCLLLSVATLAAVGARTRLAAAIASSTSGFLVAMLYVVYRSPDILLTQILIETVSTIFLLLVLVHLPPFPRRDLRRGAQTLHAVIAGAVGLSITVLLLLAMTPGLHEPDDIATRDGGLLSLSLSQGGGANAVNVIIADIRALDTTGEITVLVVVALCVRGLLRARRERT